MATNFPQQKIVTIPAPVGGINLIQPSISLPLTDAVDISNLICKPGGLTSRKGWQYHITSNFGSTVYGLHSYVSVSGTQSLWATTDAGIFNVTTSGAAPAATVVITNGVTIGAVLSTGAQNYLTLVNGTDNMQQYDGAAWTGTATVGGGAINTNTFSYVEVYRQRLYFIVKNSTRLVYLNANSVTGGGTDYDTAAIFRRGGYLVAMATWTIDGGTGPDDHLVLVTSQGELAVFAGNDPATWSYKGTYYIAQPLGMRPLVKFGGDLLYLCQAGIFPLSKALLVATLDRSVAVSNKINPVFSGAIFTTLYSWHMIIEPTIPALIVDADTGGLYCMNTQTGGWSKWTLPSEGSLSTSIIQSLVYHNGNIYASVDKRVVVLNGVTDFSSTITRGVVTGLGTWGTPLPKRGTRILPNISLTGSGIGSNTTATYTLYRDEAYTTSSTNYSSTVIPTPTSFTTFTNWRSLADNYSVLKQLKITVTGNQPSGAIEGCVVAYFVGKPFTHGGVNK